MRFILDIKLLGVTVVGPGWESNLGLWDDQIRDWFNIEQQFVDPCQAR